MRHEWDFLADESEDAATRRRARDMSLALDGATPGEVIAYGASLFGQRMAMVSSFGADSVVLLHQVAKVDPTIPVLFIDTMLHFAETLDYQKSVAERLGLSNLQRVQADQITIRLADPGDKLHESAPDDCCHLRKTLPLETALLPFSAWITGRKRYQTPDRAGMDVVEADGAGRYKLNPLATWAAADVADYFEAHDLPKHPLIARGFRSIGCQPCTRPTAEDQDPRAGRWSGKNKTECGIHFGSAGVSRRAVLKG